MTNTKNLFIEILHDDAITSEIIDSASSLFSENYGLWPNGKRVRMSPSKLKQEVCAKEAHNMCIRATVEGMLIGHVFACEWRCDEQRVSWITQLVVKHSFRNQGVATSMLRKLRQESLQDHVGILSSHPFAIMAILRAFSGGIESAKQDVEHTKTCSASIMACSPIRYVREAILNANVHCAFTDFHVDHGEPEEALEIIRGRSITWPLGELPQGHEYLMVLAPK